MADQFQLPAGATPASGNPQQDANTSANPQSGEQQFALPEGATAANAVDQNTPGFWDHVKQGIKESMVGQLAHSAFAPPENVDEVAAHAGGGDAGLFAYRQAKNIVKLHEQLTKSSGPGWHDAANKFMDAAIDYGLSSDKDPVFSGKKHDAIMNTLSGTVDAMGQIQPAVAGALKQPSDLARSTTAEGQSEGLNPTAEVTRGALDVGTLAAGAKAPEVPGAIEDAQEASAADAVTRDPATATAPVKATLTKSGIKSTTQAPSYVNDIPSNGGTVKTGVEGPNRPATTYEQVPSKLDDAAGKLSAPAVKSLDKIANLTGSEGVKAASDWIKENPKTSVAALLALGANGKKLVHLLIEAL